MLYHALWVFFIYAFLGWCTEVSYAATKTGKFVNRGFLNGPWCPIYGFGVVIVLNPGWSCEVSEYTDPGALMLSFKEDAGAEEEGAVYYLRTEAMPYTEELGLLCEEYHAESPTQLKTLGGEYIVTLGQYGSESEALEALDALNSKYGDHGLFVASGAENEIPEN